MMSIRILLSRGFSIAAFILTIFAGSEWQYSSPWISSAYLMASLIFVAFASVGRLWCSLHIAGNKNRKLVTTGPYSISRNPLYFFSLMGLVGVGLATFTLTIPIILIVGFFLYYPFVIRDEETRLQRLFPADYPAYAAAVPMLIPRHFQLVEPPLCEVNPRVFLTHALSVVWFVPAAGVILVLSSLHAAHIIPIYFRLY